MNICQTPQAAVAPSVTLRYNDTRKSRFKSIWAGHGTFGRSLKRYRIMAMMDQIKTDMKKVHLAYAPTQQDADAWISLLEKSGIHAEKGSGIRDLYAIGSPVGIEILVPEEDAPRAQELLKTQIHLPDSSGTSPNAAGKTLMWVVVSVIAIAALLFIRVLVLRQ